jgi:hypothetical protein
MEDKDSIEIEKVILAIDSIFNKYEALDKNEHTCVKASRILRNIATIVDELFEQFTGEKVPFTLVAFTKPSASYLCNFNREEAIKEINNFLAVFKADKNPVAVHDMISTLPDDGEKQ